MQDPHAVPEMPEFGLLLLDFGMKVVAIDRGAAAILKIPAQNRAVPSIGVPHEIAESITNRRGGATPHSQISYRAGMVEYACRCYYLEARNGSLGGQTVIAVHFEKVMAHEDSFQEVTAKYNLTEREQQALRGVLMGLSTKEVADQMKISPNTVKAFLRLIMIKLGVTTRWGVIAKVLGNRDGRISTDGPMDGDEGGGVPRGGSAGRRNQDRRADPDESKPKQFGSAAAGRT